MAHGHLLLAGFMANRSFQKLTGENSREDSPEGKQAGREKDSKGDWACKKALKKGKP